MTDEAKNPYYVKDVPLPETPEPGENPRPWQTTNIVGKPETRVDAYERVSGTAVFPSDVQLPDMLYGALLRSPYPNAVVEQIDTTRAEQMPGIRAVLCPRTADEKVKWFYGGRVERPVFEDACKYEGEVVAAVAAETPHQAWDAVRAIDISFKNLPYVVDEMQALDPQAPKVHNEGNQVGEAQMNERGDVAAGFDQADVVLEESYETACELHTPLELHGCVAQWDGDQLTLWESTQGVFSIQSRVARMLDMPLSKVRVIGNYMGGGFGSKLRPGKYTVVAAMLAKKTGRPVKLILSREETFLAVGNRPPSHMKLKAGVKKDGTLTALDFSVRGTGGAFQAGGTSLVDWLIRDLYTCPNVRCKSEDVFIHAGPARPFRAPGHPQGAWALEQMMDALARKLDMDPVELRLKNIPRVSQAREGLPPYSSSGLRKCLEQGSRAFGWGKVSPPECTETDRPHLCRGVGMASALWIAGGGGPPSTIVLKLFSDGSVNLNMGASDIGTGTKTIMAMVVAEELGIKTDVIQIEHADTGSTQYATSSGGSKTVPTEAPAVRDAALAVKRQLKNFASEELDQPTDNLAYRGQEIVCRSDSKIRIAVTDLRGLKRSGVIVGVGYRGPNVEGKVVNPFAAQFCEVEVNALTGEVKILRFLGAHDSGRVMNRLTYDSQVYGGITMGIGFAMTEERILDRTLSGKMVNRNWHDYKIPTALDVPMDMTSVPIDDPDDEANSTGAKGLGEPVTIPTAAAIANAVFDAVGIRVTKTPMNPAQLCRLLAESRKEG